MGKDTKEMLKTIISNQELIMKHLNIKKDDSKSEKTKNSPVTKPVKKKSPPKK